MMEWITAEPLSALIVAISGLLASVSTAAILRKKNEPPPVGSHDATRAALAENTTVQRETNGKFGENLRMFADVVKALGELILIMRGIAEDIRMIERHQSAIRDRIGKQ